MNRFISLMSLSMLTVVCATRTWSQQRSDEETLKKLELEGAKHAGTSDADIAYKKSNSAAHVIELDPLGHVMDQTPADVEKMGVRMREDDPDAKASVEISDIKVRISGDTAIVTYSGILNETGHKDARSSRPTATIRAETAPALQIRSITRPHSPTILVIG